jgi:hypothetical protein
MQTSLQEMEFLCVQALVEQGAAFVALHLLTPESLCIDEVPSDDR